MRDRLPAPASAIAAIIYPPDQPPEALMAGFAAELAARGFRIGGLLQETRLDGDDCKCAMEVIELDSGRRLSLSQSLGKGAASCSLDLTALAEASGAVRRGVESRVDLLFANKYSKTEMTGGGLAAELLQAMAGGVPLLTAVPGPLIAEWTAFTGGMGDILMPTEDALWRWWGPEHLYDDLILATGAEPAVRVVIGPKWIFVEGPHGAGLARRPEGIATPACHDWTGQPLNVLAALTRSWDPLDAAVGMAAICAHANRFDLEGEAGNGLDGLDCDPAGLVVIGAFPGLAERRPGVRIIDRHPGPGQYPEEAAQWLLPAAEGILVTASALANHSLPSILRRATHAPVTLVGPSAPLSPRLFRYGIAALSGLVVTDGDGMARAVAEGAQVKEMKRFGRETTLRRD